MGSHRLEKKPGKYLFPAEIIEEYPFLLKLGITANRIGTLCTWEVVDYRHNRHLRKREVDVLELLKAVRALYLRLPENQRYEPLFDEVISKLQARFESE